MASPEKLQDLLNKKNQPKMNFTKEQTSDLLFDLVSEKGGTHLLLNLTLGCHKLARS